MNEVCSLLGTVGLLEYFVCMVTQRLLLYISWPPVLLRLVLRKKKEYSDIGVLVRTQMAYFTELTFI